MTADGAPRLMPLPAHFSVVLDATTRQVNASTVSGGQPTRVLHLSVTGRAAWCELQDGVVRSASSGMLARRLTDAGLAHPRPPAAREAADVVVIIPARDRLAMLERCLAAQGRGHPVVVVDDGSVDAIGVARICAEHAVHLVRRNSPGGPGVARNTGLAAFPSVIAAFLDSDCVPEPGWIDELTPHFTDPLVAAVAPRVVAVAKGQRTRRCLLDLGVRDARVVPGGRVSYLPTAALLARRAALEQVARGGATFDTALRYGEDVDVVWRLHEAGWRIRYVSSVRVRHHEPDAWTSSVVRSFQYGTAAAGLAQRHPGTLASMVVHPLPALTVAALLARRPRLAAASLGAAALVMRRAVTRAGLPAADAGPATMAAVRQAWEDLSRAAVRFGAPALLAALAVPGAGSRRRRAAAVAVLAGAAAPSWSLRRPRGNVVSAALQQLATDVAYGTGVHASCARLRTSAPLRPRVVWRSSRVLAPTAAAVPGACARP